MFSFSRIEHHLTNATSNHLLFNSKLSLPILSLPLFIYFDALLHSNAIPNKTKCKLYTIKEFTSLEKLTLFLTQEQSRNATKFIFDIPSKNSLKRLIHHTSYVLQFHAKDI